MGFSLPRLRRCCCCSLRTGALVIGYISIISSIICLAAACMFIVLVAIYVNENTGKGASSNTGHSDEQIRRAAMWLYTVYGLQLFVFTIYLIISLLLVVGAHTNRPKLMRYYFIAGVVNVVFSFVMIIFNFVFVGFITTVVQLILCALCFYFLLVIRSSYLEMEDQQIMIQSPRIVEMKIINTQQQPLMA